MSAATSPHGGDVAGARPTMVSFENYRPLKCQKCFSGVKGFLQSILDVLVHFLVVFLLRNPNLRSVCANLRGNAQ